MKIPDKVPEKGFYYHYKHDPKGPFNNYAYEVLGIARHTEDESLSVIYRPLYENRYLEGMDCSNRPLEMFMEDVTKDGKTFPRFTKITDEAIISELKTIKSHMYGEDSSQI